MGVLNDKRCNAIITSFDANSSNTAIWQPVVSSQITAGNVTIRDGINYITDGYSFTVTFNTIVPSTTYTVTGLISSSSSTTSTLPNGISTVTFYVGLQENNTPITRAITITLSDRSQPLTLTTVGRGNQYYHTFYTMSTTDETVMKMSKYDNTGTLDRTQDISFGGMRIKDVLSLINGGGGTTNPYAIGIVDSSLNKIGMDIAFCGVYTKPWTERQKMKLMTYVNTTFKEPHTYMTAIYTVTFSDGVFVCRDSSTNAVVSVPISLSGGSVYMFDQSDSSNYDIFFRLSSTSTFLTEVTSGVTTTSRTPGTFNSYTIISPTTNISVYPYTNNFYYYVKVVSNAISQSVFSLSTSLNGTYYNQPNITFAAGNRYTFYVSDPSVSGYNLVFGNNEIANSSLYSVVGTPGQPGAYVLLDPVQYSGSAIIQYFEQTRTGMGYYPFVSMLATPPDNVWYKFEAGDISSNGVKNYITNTYSGTTMTTAGTGSASNSGTTITSTTFISGSRSISLSSRHYIRFATTSATPSTTSMTMSIWMKTAASNTYTISSIFPLWQYAPANGAGTANGLYFEFKEGGIKLFYGVGVNNVVLTAASTFINGLWHHICIVVDATNIKFYYDNSLLSTITLTNLISTSRPYTDYSNIGAGDWYTGLAVFQGYVDDYRMYTTALSATEVEKLYKYRDEITYDVTINEGVIYLNGVSNPTITFQAGSVYIFNQSDASNTNKQIYFSQSVTGVPVYTSGETIVGTPGQTGAYTKLINADTFTGSLYYFVP